MKYFPEMVYRFYLPKKVKIVNTGATSVVYKHKTKGMVYGLTTDADKIKWLKFNTKRFSFSLLEEIPNTLTNGVIYKYEMVKLTPLSKKEEKFLQQDVFNILRKLYTTQEFVGIGELNSLSKFIFSKDLKKEFKRIVKCFGTDSTTLELDLHIGQVLKNSKGKYVIIDPVFRSNS